MRKSDEGKEGQLEEHMSKERHREKKRQSARSSFHTSNEVTQHRWAAGEQPIAISAADTLSRRRRRGQTGTEQDARTEQR